MRAKRFTYRTLPPSVIAATLIGVRILSAACAQAIRPSTARAQGSLANSPSAPRNSTQHAQCLGNFDRSLRIAVAESPTPIRCNIRFEAPCAHRDRRLDPIRFPAVRDRKKPSGAARYRALAPAKRRFDASGEAALRMIRRILANRASSERMTAHWLLSRLPVFG